MGALALPAEVASMARRADARRWRGRERGAAAWSACGPTPSLPAEEREAHGPETEADHAGGPLQQRLAPGVVAGNGRRFGGAGAEREGGDDQQRAPTRSPRPVLALGAAPAATALPTFAYPAHLRLS